MHKKDRSHDEDSRPEIRIHKRSTPLPEDFWQNAMPCDFMTPDDPWGAKPAKYRPKTYMPTNECDH